jgi:hypothetical protein
MFPFQRIEIPNIRDGPDGFWFKWAARIWGLGKLTTIIVQSGLFCNFMCSTLIILICIADLLPEISLSQSPRICCLTHCSTMSTVTFKMASEALQTKNERGAMDREIFTLASKFSEKWSAFPN